MSGLAAYACLSVLSSVSESWKPLQVSKEMTLEVPTGWKQTIKGQTYAFTAPLEDAQFELSVMPVDPVRTPKQCFDKLWPALGKGWKRGKTGGLPAALKVSFDKSRKVETQTRQYVGCDGRVKWVMSFTYSQKEQKTYSETAKRVFESIQYGN